MIRQHAELILEMMAYEEGCPQRTQHFLKVWAFAKLIGGLEILAEETREILEISAIVHDIGIRLSLEKYGTAAGSYQELEGPPVARGLLESLGYDPQVISRVCYLVGHHHTYEDIDGLDYQILIEADFLVNIFESKMDAAAISEIRRTIFRTKSGKEIFDRLYQKVGQ